MGSSSSSLASSSSISHRRKRSVKRVDPDLPPPPPYDEPLSPSYQRAEAEDALELLAKVNTVFIVDDSSSMQGERWQEAKNAIATLADLAGTYDTDGIDVHFLNHEAVGRHIKDSHAINELFRGLIPKGVTPIGNKLEELLLEYLSIIEPLHNKPAELKKIKPINFLIITDGYPTDDPESVIVQVAKRLDDKYLPITQVGIQFVQIGNDMSATQYLRDLDDGLSNKHRIRDIVDTTPYQGPLHGSSLLKILLGGINRRVDAHGSDAFL
ncbi:hypothetical protein AX14_004188 [Amanita brunnescens Koide BX004]|nr:hypothetical protein AX14_004188 [Amanita brunnescens Koide BX004]